MRLHSTPGETLRTVHIGGYWRGTNDLVRQMMLSLSAAGVEVYEYNTDVHQEALDTDGRPYDRGGFGPVWLRWEAFRGPIGAFRPHLIVCNAGGLSFRPEVAEKLRKRTCLLGIALSDPDVFELSTGRIASYFDYFLTNLPELIPEYQKLGARVGALPAATNEEFFHPVPARPDLRCDVLVIGQAHSDRVEPVRSLVLNFDTHIYGEGWEAHGLPSRGLVFAEEALAALNSARIAVVFFGSKSGHPMLKGAVFDFVAAGALVATNSFPEMADHMTYGEEIIGFRSTTDLVEKIRYYLDHPEDAEKIRAAGRRRVLRDYTWRRVWQRILNRLAEAPQ